MPLKDHSAAKAFPVGTLLDQRERGRSQHDQISRSNTPLNKSNEARGRRDSAVSNGSHVSNPLGAKDVLPTRIEQQRRAIGMKLTLPETIGSSNVAANSTMRTHGYQDERGIFREHENQNDRKSVFDDTTSMAIDDETSSQENERDLQTTVFRADYKQALQDFTSRGPGGQQNSTFDDTIEFEHSIAPENWQDEVRTERLLQGKEGRTYNDRVSTFQDMQSQSAEGRLTTVTDTPSRANGGAGAYLRHPIPLGKGVTFATPDAGSGGYIRNDSPELDMPGHAINTTAAPSAENHKRNDNKQRSNKGAQARNLELRTNRNPFTKSYSELHGRGKVLAKQPQVSTFGSSRASDYPTSSEDERAPAHSKHSSPIPAVREPIAPKRQREEDIDYDMTVLKSMKFNDLSKEGFGLDPRNPTSSVTFDSQANPVPLAHRLRNLSKMTEDEQKVMFRNQSDEEWTEMGSWFVEMFQEGLRKMNDIRVERRKISMKYEDEIRRRQKNVEHCSIGLEDELRDLKKGGGDLIRGRDASSRRGTPQKR